MDYLDDIKTRAIKTFNKLTFEEFTNGVIPDFYFSYTRFGTLLNNLRHLSHHIGALHARLTVLGNERLPWINIIYGDERDTFDDMSSQGLKYMQEGNLDEAEKIYIKITDKSQNPIYLYNLACVYSLKKNQVKAIETLRICFKLDPNNYLKESAKRDSDFTNIHELPAFQELITK